MAAAMKHMVANFFKLDKIEGVDFRSWQNKMHFILSTMSVVCVLTTPKPEDGKNVTIEQIRKMSKWKNDDYVCRGIILNDIYLLRDPSRRRIETSQRAIMVEHNNSTGNANNMGKLKHQDTKANPNKKSKVTCWKCKKPRHLDKD
nr:zinc finger, CCHC-type [Tanacetum cinerariifolium]